MNRETASTFARLTGADSAAIGAIRASGPRLPEWLARHTTLPADALSSPPALRRAALRDADGQPIDDVLVWIESPPPAAQAEAHAAAPTVRIHTHGNPYLIRRCAELLARAGFREDAAAATNLWPGDALRREYAAALPRMITLAGARWLAAQERLWRSALRAAINAAQGADDAALAPLRDVLRSAAERADVVEWFATPARIALVGPPNAGKSTLLNALAGWDASLVSATPGSTRDYVDAGGEAAGYPLIWIDTAGLRPASDELEQAGVARTLAAARGADAVVAIIDGSAAGAAVQSAFLAAHESLRPALVIANKSDLPDFNLARLTHLLPAGWPRPALPISAARQEFPPDFADRICAALGRPRGAGDPSAAGEPPLAAFCPLLRQIADRASDADRKSLCELLLGVLA